MDDLRWLWKMSALVCEHENPHTKKIGFGAVRVLKRRLYYVAKSLRLISSLQVYMHPREGSPLQRVMEQRPGVGRRHYLALYLFELERQDLPAEN